MKVDTEFKANVTEPIQYISSECPFCYNKIKKAKLIELDGYDYFESYMAVRKTFSKTYDELLAEREKSRACMHLPEGI